MAEPIIIEPGDEIVVDEFPFGMDYKPSPGYDDKVLLFDPVSGKPVYTNVEDFVSAAGNNVIGAASPGDSPSGTETDGQSYMVSNKTGAVLVFPNFLTSVPDGSGGFVPVQMAAGETAGYIIKSGGSWVYLDNTAVADTGDLVPKSAITNDPSSSDPSEVLGGGLLPKLTPNGGFIGTSADLLQSEKLLSIGVNIFDKTKAKRGGFLLPDGITWHVQAGYDVSDFMKVEQGQTYCIGGDSGSYNQYAWSYKADKTLHTYYVIPGNPIPRKFIPSADEVFLKTTTLTASYDSFMVAKSITYPVSYIPYSEFIKPQFLPNPLPTIQNQYDLGAIDLQIPITDWVDLSDYGQSLSTGQQSYPSLTTLNFRGNKMIGNQVWLNYNGDGTAVLNNLISKRAASSIGLALTRTAASQDEPFIISFANSAKLLSDRMTMSNKSTFIANSTGTDGKSIEQLLLDIYYNIFKDKLIKLKGMADAASKTVSCPIIIFVQGEYNYYDLSGSSDKDIYKSNCLILKNKMQTDVKNIYGQISLPLFMTYQTTGPYTHNNECSIGMAQLEFALENNDCAIVCPSYNFSNRGAHLDANGYRWMGQQFAKAWAKILRGEKFLPLYPTRVIKETDTQLRILFYVPVAPLVFDSKIVNPIANNGFYVYNENGELAINNVTIDGNSVLITLASAMTGNVRCSYASLARTGRGNLRDSDRAMSMYNYIDLDGKDGGGNFIYPRDAGETTLRPDFEPKDDAGLVIYNKPYPLYNFCMAFSIPVIY